MRNEYFIIEGKNMFGLDKKDIEVGFENQLKN